MTTTLAERLHCTAVVKLNPASASHTQLGKSGVVHAAANICSKAHLACLRRFAEGDVAMMLTLLQSCGHQLRSDDSISMKVRFFQTVMPYSCLTYVFTPVCRSLLVQKPLHLSVPGGPSKDVQSCSYCRPYRPDECVTKAACTCVAALSLQKCS